MSHAAQSYIKTDWSEKAKEYLASAAAVHADILPEERNSELYIEGFYTYSNAQVLYYVYDSVDYHKALTYVSEALELADSRWDIRQSVIFGLNHVILNTMLQESFAYEGAEDLYAKAVELKDSKLLPARERVASALRKAIISKSIPEGAELTLENTAQELGVSVTPVREAFQILARDGLLEVKQNRCAIVLGVTEKTIREH